jgi:hypothetical protein
MLIKVIEFHRILSMLVNGKLLRSRRKLIPAGFLGELFGASG